ncbi:hypothetical protein EZV62_025998 [Acer yangbiense]|uniref:Uncharacterized protein n=1 Tax=Acer yangbiense TaxID=1000413 RepID=A0A5C7GZP1_9ROSI|nr:hypothetical protein EZV62_025998 [Acer yangbiense]
MLRDKEDMAELVRNWPIEFKEYYIQIQALPSIHSHAYEGARSCFEVLLIHSKASSFEVVYGKLSLASNPGSLSSRWMYQLGMFRIGDGFSQLPV